MIPINITSPSIFKPHCAKCKQPIGGDAGCFTVLSWQVVQLFCLPCVRSNNVNVGGVTMRIVDSPLSTGEE